MKKNLRNVRPIGRIVGTYRNGSGDYVCAGPESARPHRLVDLRDYPSALEALRSVLDELTGERVPLSQIILLTPHNQRSDWQDKMAVGDYTLVRGIRHPGGKAVCAETIYSFKGLERSVVILSELDRIGGNYQDRNELNNLLYVGLSRAKHHLIVLGALPAPSNP